MEETWVPSLDQEDNLEQEMATYSSVLAWRIPWTEEPGGLQSIHGVAKSWTQLKCSGNTKGRTVKVVKVVGLG